MNIKGIIAAAFGAGALSTLHISSLPDGWSQVATQQSAAACATKIFRSSSGDENEFRIVCHRPTGGMVSVIQTFAAAPYRGKRMQFAARLRTHALQGRVGLLVRAESENKGILAFDDMRTRPVSGTNEWSEHRVLLDIDDIASTITIGILIEGAPGAVSAGRVRFDEVPADNWELSLRLRSDPQSLPAQPQNLELRR